jgi:N-methylhydantoinase B
VLRYGLVPDSGGTGRYRGGLGLIREYRLAADDAVLTIRTDRRDHPPYGLAGGRPGTPSLNVVNPGPDERVLPTLPMEAVRLKRGDVFRHYTAGAGGYGDPLTRDPARVLEDVLDEKLTVEYARREYGVAIDLVAQTVDEAATARLRADLAASRADAGRADSGRASSQEGA